MRLSPNVIAAVVIAGGLFQLSGTVQAAGPVPATLGTMGESSLVMRVHESKKGYHDICELSNKDNCHRHEGGSSIAIPCKPIECIGLDLFDLRSGASKAPQKKNPGSSRPQ